MNYICIILLYFQIFLFTETISTNVIDLRSNLLFIDNLFDENYKIEQTYGIFRMYRYFTIHLDGIECLTEMKKQSSENLLYTFVQCVAKKFTVVNEKNNIFCDNFFVILKTQCTKNENYVQMYNLIYNKILSGDKSIELQNLLWILTANLFFITFRTNTPTYIQSIMTDFIFNQTEYYELRKIYNIKKDRQFHKFDDNLTNIILTLIIRCKQERYHAFIMHFETSYILHIFIAKYGLDLVQYEVFLNNFFCITKENIILISKYIKIDTNSKQVQFDSDFNLNTFLMVSHSLFKPEIYHKLFSKSFLNILSTLGGIFDDLIKIFNQLLRNEISIKDYENKKILIMNRITIKIKKSSILLQNPYINDPFIGFYLDEISKKILEEKDLFGERISIYRLNTL